MRNSIKKGLIALVTTSLIVGAVYLYSKDYLKDVGHTGETLRVYYIDVRNEPESRSYDGK